MNEPFNQYLADALAKFEINNQRNALFYLLINNHPSDVMVVLEMVCTVPPEDLDKVFVSQSCKEVIFSQPHLSDYIAAARTYSVTPQQLQNKLQRTCAFLGNPELAKDAVVIASALSGTIRCFDKETEHIFDDDVVMLVKDYLSFTDKRKRYTDWLSSSSSYRHTFAQPKQALQNRSYASEAAARERVSSLEKNFLVASQKDSAPDNAAFSEPDALLSERAKFEKELGQDFVRKCAVQPPEGLPSPDDHLLFAPSNESADSRVPFFGDDMCAEDRRLQEKDDGLAKSIQQLLCRKDIDPGQLRANLQALLDRRADPALAEPGGQSVRHERALRDGD